MQKEGGMKTNEGKSIRGWVVALFLTIHSILIHVEAWGADWMHYGGNISFVAYYDATKITEVSKGTFSVWEKWVYSPEGVKNAVRKLGPKYSELDHIIVLSEINCAQRKYRHIQATDYAKDGTVISDVPFVL
jgi:hypothetical protein